jgi:putative ABC transport system permease protein
MLARDLRYTLRTFCKNPGFAATAVLSLALGIGANTAIFSLLDRVMLRSLPVRNPERLVLFTANGPRRGAVSTSYDDTYTFSYPMYLDFRDHAPDLSGVIAWYPIDVSASLGSRTERVAANLVSGNFFEVLGTGTAIGRPLVAADTRTLGGNAVAVLSYNFWQQHFSADPGILNRTLNVNGHPLTVVGVAARDFHGVAIGESPEVFIPVTMQQELLSLGSKIDSRRNMWLNVMGRLKPGISRASAEAALNVFWKPILEEELKLLTSGSPQFRRNFVNRHITLKDASNGISMLRMMFRQPLVLLMGLVGMVLLIACANVANLLIARAAGRSREIAIRLAIGATRGQIVLQILSEGMILAVGGGAAGLLLAMWGGRGLLAMLPFDGLTATISADPDWRILAFTGCVSLLCGVAFGLAPALQTTSPDLASAMKAQTGGIVSSGAQVMLRKGLVVAQIALSLVLLTGAGLFLRSMRNLKSVDLGFRADHLTSFAVQPALNGYSAPRAIALFDTLQQRLAGLPGVRAVGSTQIPLLTNGNWQSSVTVPGYQSKENDTSPNVVSISTAYFAALGIPLAAGREFRTSDDTAAPPVAVVNETFAQFYFGDAFPVGRQFYFTGDATKRPVMVVGVVKDGKYTDIREEKQRFIFCPYSQHYIPNMGGMTYYVRTSQEAGLIAASLRHTVREIDASLPVYGMKTMDRQIDDNLFSDRIVSLLSAFFGVLATLLAAIGLYGVMSYMVTRRTREIGIRMALGAGQAEVLGLVMCEVIILAAIGIAVAIPLAIALSNLAKSLLYGMTPHDALPLIGATTVLVMTALAAGYIPAARAARVDPLVALRND